MNLFKSVALLLLVSFIITGCASSVKRKNLSNPSPATYITQEQPAGRISINLTPEAKKDLADNIKFDQKVFTYKVVQTLVARSLLKKQPKDSDYPTIEIKIDDIRVRSTLTAAFFGCMAGNDSITGNVLIKDHQGNILDEFTVSASYALGGSVGGQDSFRLTWLYEKFAEEMADELTHS